MLNKNDIITAQITDIHHEGSGVARYEDMVIFVPHTAVGDICEILILKVKKGYCYGKCLKILTASKARTEPSCPVCNQCGGCNFQHISYREEKRIKTGFVNADFNIKEKLNCTVLPVMSCDKPYGYRNKAQYPVGINPDGKAVMGFYASRSHRIIPIDFCTLQPDIINAIASYTLKTINELSIKGYDENTHSGDIRHIYIRTGEQSGQIMVCLVCTHSDINGIDYLVKKVCDKFPEISSFILNINDKKTNIIMGSENIVLFGSPVISDVLSGLVFEISPQSFYQVNHDGAEKIYSLAGEFLNLNDEDILLDLYCGTGTIGLSLAKKVKTLIGVEIVPQAIENAKKNAERNGIDNARFICRDAGQAANRLLKEGFAPTAVVVDPPRKGCDTDTLNAIIKMSPEKIAMISCNSSTAARDCKYLSDNGYRIEKVQPFDMFSRTKHVECVIGLLKNN